MELKFLKRKVKEYSNRMGNVDYWKNIMDDIEINPIEFREVQPRNKKHMAVMM